ncbi:type I-A CRISPR-associated protein Cas8a2/Csa4 [Thermococcus thioreducens]|uniref:CRISPR-associated protein Cas4 n=1 Tax=Thermococcus thioreducens TaxID=277988 RepID=A0A0Q2MSL7_9EURY|nr:type I-A CRISPR-associated protein Cas8a2/Csa4 [Thermococcus thioreducens]ASJ12046.1 type I-A CRISPR-associated protein Cas8a2/Csa4 [Thermococcus thioreducens]KQH82735.1 CRISPR-associated protein Cas4 [Thermococcus thioreducens]SEW09418.1 CRISPR-associated protein Csa4 [Thermococcus thioreducens]
MKAYPTPGIDEVFDLYVAYGYVEALVRGGAEEVTLIPEGTARGGYYTVEGNGDFEEGLASALEEMLSLHYALGNYSSREGGKVISDADFSAGANINNAYWDSVPSRLSTVLEKIVANKKTSRRYPVPITLMPSAGKFLPKHMGIQGGNPLKIDSLSYALAWVGFHYYAPYVRYGKGNRTWVHIYQVAPQESLGLVELLALKDLKEHFPHYYEGSMDYLSNRRLALLYHLLHTESLGAIETVTRKSLIMRSYTLERDGNNQAIRSYGEEDIGKLMDFLWELKRRSTYYTVRFFDALLRKESEAVIAIIDAVLNDRPEGLYQGLRIAKRAGITPTQSVVEGMEAFMDET